MIIGDKIYLVKKHEHEVLSDIFTLYKCYTITDIISTFNSIKICIVADDGITWRFNSNDEHFVTLKEFRKQKVKKLI